LNTHRSPLQVRLVARDGRMATALDADPACRFVRDAIVRLGQ
jgi:hypothetical protein